MSTGSTSPAHSASLSSSATPVSSTFTSASTPKLDATESPQVAPEASTSRFLVPPGPSSPSLFAPNPALFMLKREVDQVPLSPLEASDRIDIRLSRSFHSSGVRSIRTFTHRRRLRVQYASAEEARHRPWNTARSCTLTLQSIDLGFSNAFDVNTSSTSTPTPSTKHRAPSKFAPEPIVESSGGRHRRGTSVANLPIPRARRNLASASASTPGLHHVKGPVFVSSLSTPMRAGGVTARTSTPPP